MNRSEKMEIAFVEMWNGQTMTYPELDEEAKIVVDAVRKKLKITAPAKFLGKKSFPVSFFWQQYLPQVKSALPKTDIVIDKWKLSMKYKQSHLLFQGGEGETLGSFYAALDENDENFKDYVNEIISRYASTFKTIKMIDQKSIDIITSKQEPIRKSLQEFFDNDKNFLTSLLRQILTGERKFENNNLAIANSILLYDIRETEIFPLTRENIYKHLSNVKVDIKWRRFDAKKIMRNILYLSPSKVEEGVIDTMKNIVSRGWDKVLKLFGLEPEIKIEIKW